MLADRVQIQQVIFNLMRNAVDAMAESYDARFPDANAYLSLARKELSLSPFGLMAEILTFSGTAKKSYRDRLSRAATLRDQSPCVSRIRLRDNWGWVGGGVPPAVCVVVQQPCGPERSEGHQHVWKRRWSERALRYRRQSL